MDSFDSYRLTHFNIKRFYTNNGQINHIVGSSFNCFGIILDGRARFVAGDIDFFVEKGQTVFIPKGMVYRSEWYGSPAAIFYSIPFEFYEEQFKGIQFSLQPLTLESLPKYAESIYSLANESPLLAISNFYCFYSEAQSVMKTEKRKSVMPSVAVAIRYIEENYASDFSVPQLAALCGMSESSFYSTFKKQTTLTPIEYKNKLRCIRARELLKSTDYTIEHISERLGFSSPMYMRKVLKGFTGKTPKAIRKEPSELL